MKKLLFLIPLIALILSGCAMGINHNVATIKGTQYLIETKNYGFLGSEWSEESTFTNLDNSDVDQAMIKNHMQEIVDECKSNAKVRRNSGFDSSKKAKTLDCILKKLEISSN